MLNFFDRFNDENLSYYINKAIDNNHSAKQATLRVEQYRQQVKYSFGRELPTLSAPLKNAQPTRTGGMSKTSDNTVL